MSGLFTARSPDGRSARRIIAELAIDVPRGAVLTYDEMGAALGVSDRRAVQRAASAAQRTLRAQHNRSLSSVPNIGYRVLQPDEHLMQAQQYERRSHRSLRTGLAVMNGTDMSTMTEASKTRHVAYGIVLQGMYDAIRSHHHRITRLELLVEQISKTVDEK